MGVYLDLKKSIQRELVTFSLLNLPDYFGTFAVPGAQLGETLYRTDQDKLYQYQKDVSQLGEAWVEVPYDFFFLDFDDHAQIQELPEHDIIGTKAISVDVDDHMVMMNLLIGLSIFNDSNFNKHDTVLDALFTRFLPTKQIQIYNQSSGSASGNFIAGNGLEVMPMAKADQRPVQFMSVGLYTDRTVALA